MSNTDPDESAEKPQKKKRQRHSDNWGGVREGAGRVPNDAPTIWMQLGVMLSDEEYAYLTALDLTPGQRRHRLLHPDPEAPGAYAYTRAMADAAQGIKSDVTVSDAEREEGETKVARRQYNFRIVLGSQDNENRPEDADPLEQRRHILALKQPERRRRLLTEPAGGDIEDDRPGRWETAGKDKEL